MQRQEMLQRVPLFRGLSEAARISLSQRLVERSFAAGERVFSKGDAGGVMFCVLSGRLEIFLQPESGAERIHLKDAQTGDHFGELGLFDDKPRSASVEAKTDCVLLELSREHFVTDILHNEEAVLAIIGEMASRLRDTTAQLGQRAARDVVKEFEESLAWTDKMADRVAELNGSWAFILGLLGLTLAWAVMNAFIPRPFDAYPYQFFNLFLGILVGVQGPLIMMSQNRQAAKDRAQASTDFRVNLKNEVGIETLAREIAQFRQEMEQRLGDLEQSDEPSARSARAS
jgi:CRP/FNR family transcriptional regulator, cyclic AMP receptor protein